MKKILLSLLVIAFTVSTNAQIKTPAPSPFSKVEQVVGLTDVTLEYSRPGAKGRTIFGDLVPFNKIWRTGANSRTKITFSTDVSIDGQNLKKGTYAIFTKPSATSWEVYFYTEYKGNGAPQKWDDTKIAAKTTAQVQPMPMKIETFTMTFDDLTSSSAMLGMLWENAYVGVKIDVPTGKMVADNITKVMAGPSAADYYASASYYLEEGKDIQKAKTWINKAVDMTNGKAPFWYLRKQSLILAKAGDKAGAITAAKASLAGAEARGNADYIKMNKEFLKKMM
ncbi:DUF2911 domain-containing protein [Tenacibaculum aquimarinum]|uniref:DUF2911 domain-containing protein n=1 Tax=Tenacibaculum aquimarinum TaxID=2910675 RepID=UPI001F0A9432|nr:DUF2911 domain-containing protein [Tenacibaculum aquimarinum]MCH3884798.1 DUF2911 domain-containing protein [Tenacibaculum aquimarinum]